MTLPISIDRAHKLGGKLSYLRVLELLTIRQEWTPVGVIMDLLKMSKATVDRALSWIKAHGLFKASKLRHEHAYMEHDVEHKGTASQVSQPLSPEAVETVDTVDNLRAELVALDIFPGAATNLIRKYGEAVVAEQLKYLKWRIAKGWPFSQAPAALLYNCIRNNHPAPDGYHLEAGATDVDLYREEKSKAKASLAERAKQDRNAVPQVSQDPEPTEEAFNEPLEASDDASDPAPNPNEPTPVAKQATQHPAAVSVYACPAGWQPSYRKRA